METKRLTPWLWFSPIAINSNSSTFPVLLAILLPVSPAPAAGLMNVLVERNQDFKSRSSKEAIIVSPPNDAAIATEPATVPAALAAAANPLAPITGIIVPSVGANAPNPAAIAGAAKPVEE